MTPIIKLVDGSKIRKSISHADVLAGRGELSDFLDFGIHDTLRRHGGFVSVPEGEIWIAEELDLEEMKVVVEVAKYRYECLAKGMPAEQARMQGELLGDQLRHEWYGSSYSISDVYIKQITGIAKDFKVIEVSGFKVRNMFSNSFIQGGHGYVYDYVPKDEVWIDDTLDDDEYKAVAVHETVEARLMRDGMIYEDAHQLAMKEEYKYR